jgi:hypothetical protein
MATWVDYKTTDYTGYLTATYKESGRVKVTLQYDKDTVTPTTMKIRFKIDNPKDYYRGDEYFIFWRPNDKNDEKFFRVKKADAAWPDYSETLTITKNYKDSGFSIPEHWLCHTGNICNGKTAFTKTDGYLYMTYGDAATKKIYWYFTNNRTNYKTIISSYTVSKVSGTVATDVTPGSITITDNGNTTFSITASGGVNGTNNPVTSTTLYYKLASSDNYTKASGLSVKNVSLDSSTSNKYRTVYAYVEVKGTYGSKITSSTVSEKIINYRAPTSPGTPVISYNRSRLTVKEDWKYTWSAATKANDNSAVAGYRIRIYKNGSEVTGLKLGSDDVITKGTGSNTWVDRENTTLTATFDPVDLGFNPKDKVKLGVYAYSKNNKGTPLWSGSGKTQSVSAESTVQNAGIVHIKNSGTWVEGQVWVKISGEWKEAVSVQTKVSGEWKESI